MTLTYVIHIDTHHPNLVEAIDVGRAIARAIEHTLDCDVEGAEALNRDDIGQITVYTTDPVRSY